MSKKICKHCERPDSTGYSLWDNKEPFIQKFQTVKKLNTGELVACPLCKSKWIKLFSPREKNSTTVSLDFVPEESLSVLDDWDSKTLVPTAAQKKVLKKIGATPPDIYTNGSEYIRFPCKCILKDGRTLDFCIIEFRRVAPGLEGTEKPIYLDEVKEILPSEYTLSRKVRYATTRADEVTNSYAPTVVRLPSGGKYIFNWTNHFFASKKIKGSTIKQVLKEDAFDVVCADVSETGKFLSYEETYIYAHWNEDYLSMELNENNLND
jgi:hypothetical protein